MTQVRTRAGIVEGTRERGLDVFRGIAYARPPVDELRFRPPQPVREWAGIRQAAEFGPSSPQGGRLPRLIRPLLAPGPGGLSQDCLYLNVWTPGCDDARRPVMVWIHGGAFTLGSGSTSLYAGHRLAKRGDVVVVTLNYRLGALGFLNLKALEPDSDDAPANLGLQDQLAALEWVRDNIEAFGGDPGRVTIFGESAGGMCVSTLLGMRRAQGLFHRAIAQSGAASHVASAERGAEIAALFLRELGVDRGDMKALRELPVGDLLRAQTYTSLRLGPDTTLPWQPSLDGSLLPQPPLQAIAQGVSDAVPLIVGSNRDEMKLFRFGDMALRRLNEAGLERNLRASLPGHDAQGRPLAERALEVYGPRGSRRGRTSPAERWSSFQSDQIFHYPAAQLAEVRARRGAPTFAYLFTYAPPLFGARLGACHGLELPFVFGTLRDGVLGTTLGALPAARNVSRRMQHAWTSFARNGNPGHEALPEWPRYAPPERATMAIGSKWQVETSRFDDVRRFWEEVDELTGAAA